MIYLGYGWEILVLLFLLWIVIRAILKSMDRRLDEIFSLYDARGGGKRVPRRGTSKGEGDS